MSNNIISNKAKIGRNVKIGSFCIIEDDVIIGDNTEIKNYVELRSGTIIGSNCIIDSKVSSSGNCTIGNNVIIRYHSIIARGSVIKNNVYISPKVMFNNLNEDKNQIGGAKIEDNTFIGTGSVLHHGITIGKNSIIGALSFVNKNIPNNEIWFGNPAIFKKKNN